MGRRLRDIISMGTLSRSLQPAGGRDIAEGLVCRLSHPGNSEKQWFEGFWTACALSPFINRSKWMPSGQGTAGILSRVGDAEEYYVLQSSSALIVPVGTQSRQGSQLVRLPQSATLPWPTPAITIPPRQPWHCMPWAPLPHSRPIYHTIYKNKFNINHRLKCKTWNLKFLEGNR